MEEQLEQESSIPPESHKGSTMSSVRAACIWSRGHGSVSVQNQACHYHSRGLVSMHSLAFLSKSFGKIPTTYLKLFTFIFNFIFVFRVFFSFAFKLN